MLRVLVLGAGGHAQVVADILLCARESGREIEPSGYLDDNPALIGQTRLGLPILGRIADLSSVGHDAVIIAIGNNGVRRRLFDELLAAGEALAIACHPRSIIARDVVLQPGTVVCAGVVVNPGCVVGQNVILNTSCSIDHHNWIGDHAHIAPGAHLGGDVRIGAGTLVGIGATVMPQRHVGEWSTIGAGALVQQDIPDQVTAIGLPARVFRGSSTSSTSGQLA